MFRILLFVFIAFPILELALLIHVGEIIGALNTIFLLVASAAIGLALMRYAGLRTVGVVQQRLAQGKLPGFALLEGVQLLLAGVLFLLPGFTTDFIALLFVLPVSRTLLRWGIMALLTKTAKSGMHSVAVRSDVVEGEFRRESQVTGSEQAEIILKLPQKHE